MRNKILILTALFLSLFKSSPLFASWERKPIFRLEGLYRFDLREDNHSLYTNRISATFIYLDKENKALFKLKPFFYFRAIRRMRIDVIRHMIYGRIMAVFIQNFIFIYFKAGPNKFFQRDSRHPPSSYLAFPQKTVQQRVFIVKIIPDKIKSFISQTHVKLKAGYEFYPVFSAGDFKFRKPADRIMVG